MKVPGKWAQRDVNTAIRLVERAGKTPGEVVFDPDGAIRIVLRTGAADEPARKWKLQ